MPLVPSNVPSPTQQSQSQSCQVQAMPHLTCSLGSQLSLVPRGPLPHWKTHQQSCHPPGQAPCHSPLTGCSGLHQTAKAGRPLPSGRDSGTHRHSGKQSRGMAQTLDTLMPFFFFFKLFRALIMTSEETP